MLLLHHGSRQGVHRAHGTGNGLEVCGRSLLGQQGFGSLYLSEEFVVVHKLLRAHYLHQLMGKLHQSPALLPLLGRCEAVELLVGLLYLLLLKVALDGGYLVVDAREQAFAVGLIEPFGQLPVCLVIEHLVNLQLRELAAQTQRTLNGDVEETEVVAVENLRLHGVLRRGFLLLKRHVSVENLLAVKVGDGAVARALVLAQLLVTLRGVDQLHLATALSQLLVGENPHIGGDARVVEDVVGQLHYGVHQVVLHQIAAYVALAAASVAREERTAVVDGGNAAAHGLHVERLHLVNLLKHKKQLSVGGAWGAVEHLRFACKVGEL